MHKTFFLLFILLSSPAAFAEILSDVNDQAALSLTIYNNDLALVRDRRKVELPAGEQELAIRGVSGRLQPETALLESRDGSGEIRVLEQNFNYDLLTPRKLLEKYLGRQVDILRTNPATGEVTRDRATVLSTEEGLVVRIGKRIETNPGGRFVFSDIPENLRDRPTLVTRLMVARGGSHLLELSYLSGGLGWKADYVARLDEKGTRMELAGWVTLENRSGTAYTDARLQLVAGDVNRVSAAPAKRRFQPMMVESVADAGVREEALFEYHLYTLPRPTTLLDRQTKQLALLSAGDIPVTREYLLQGQQYYYQGRYGEIGRRLPVGVWLKFRNDETAHLGLPLPAGVVRVYRSGSQGNLQFVGEDRIAHTPRGEEVRLRLGNAFDITARRVQTDFRKQNFGHPYKFAAQSSFRITLRNAKEEPVEVLVREPMPGDWQVLSESEPHEKPDARTAQWKLQVPAQGETVLEYSVLVRY